MGKEPLHTSKRFFSFEDKLYNEMIMSYLETVFRFLVMMSTK